MFPSPFLIFFYSKGRKVVTFLKSAAPPPSPPAPDREHTMSGKEGLSFVLLFLKIFFFGFTVSKKSIGIFLPSHKTIALCLDRHIKAQIISFGLFFFFSVVFSVRYVPQDFISSIFFSCEAATQCQHLKNDVMFFFRGVVHKSGVIHFKIGDLYISLMSTPLWNAIKMALSDTPNAAANTPMIH